MGDAFMVAMDLDARTAVYSADLLAALCSDAFEGCSTCSGSGIVTYATNLDVNFHNVGAALVARVIGLDLGPGRADLALLRLLVAPVRRENARLGLGDGRAPLAEHGWHGEPTADGTAARVARLGAFLDVASEAGAEFVTWG